MKHRNPLPRKVLQSKKRTPAQTLRKLTADARIADFQGWCRRHGLPIPIAEYRWHPTRKWRHDFFWPTHQLALENQGGLWSNGRHSRGASLLKEHEKLNDAAKTGHRVLFSTPQTIKSREMLAVLTAILQPTRRDPMMFGPPPTKPDDVAPYWGTIQRYQRFPLFSFPALPPTQR